ncbi:hypothetical protein [Streptomyces sp. TLI_171]|uniref:hypothetical protein n=1 Tax=Streptomyces sp. TLI_171 TaxID=1938859 RepID=UPI000C195FE0|nr:hypothetical protein [Streptomyces sp. TLI_171]RKE21780.1 hypothetical protein BX266_5180 [Streptomyces sp. TLI_171]
MPTPADRLAEARTSGDPAVLRRLVDTGYPFVHQALAVNPRTPPDALARLAGARHGGWNDNLLLHLLAEQPAVVGPVLEAVLAAVADQLAAGERPYAAALALAARADLPAERVRALGSATGASARLRRGLERRLAARP